MYLCGLPPRLLVPFLMCFCPSSSTTTHQAKTHPLYSYACSPLPTLATWTDGHQSTKSQALEYNTQNCSVTPFTRRLWANKREVSLAREPTPQGRLQSWFSTEWKNKSSALVCTDSSHSNLCTLSPTLTFKWANWLLFQRTEVQSSAPTQQLTTIFNNPSSTWFKNACFWPLWAFGIHMVHRQTCQPNPCTHKVK